MGGVDGGVFGMVGGRVVVVVLGCSRRLSIGRDRGARVVAGMSCSVVVVAGAAEAGLGSGLGSLVVEVVGVVFGGCWMDCYCDFALTGRKVGMVRAIDRVRRSRLRRRHCRRRDSLASQRVFVENTVEGGGGGRGGGYLRSVAPPAGCFGLNGGGPRCRSRSEGP